MNQFRNPPKIEELSDLSWKRVEQQMFQKMDQAETLVDLEPAPPSSRKELWTAGAVALCAAAAVLFFTRGGPASQDQAPAEVASATQRSRIMTQSASTEVVVGDATIEVAPESAIWIDTIGESITVTLDDGGVRLKVAPREHRAPVAVLAGNVRVEVMGTEFGVYHSGGATQVEVFEGVVSVIANGKRNSVSAGEEWPASEVAHKSRRRNTKARRQRKGHKEEQFEEIAPTARELYEQAVALESSAPDAAIALYRQVAAEKGPWAANALYAHARLEASRGNKERAARLLSQYLKKYPGGANARDAEELLSD